MVFLAMSVEANGCNVPISRSQKVICYLFFNFNHVLDKDILKGNEFQQKPCQEFLRKGNVVLLILLKVTLLYNLAVLEGISVLSEIIVLCKETKAYPPCSNRR